MELVEVGIDLPVSIVVDSAIARTAKRNVAACFARKLPRFHDLPLGTYSGPLAIVGGGPSLRGQLPALRSFPGHVMACGTTHDYLVEQGIRPTYHINGEPDEDGVMLRWLRRPRRGITYLLASHCPQAMFNILAGYDVRVWHLDVPPGPDRPDFRGEPAIPGGHFIIARAWPLAAVMGYRDFHFFGFDCSFPEDCEDQHAYDYGWTLEEPCGVTVGGRRYVSTAGLLAQLQCIGDMVRNAPGLAVTVHGDGLAAAVLA